MRFPTRAAVALATLTVGLALAWADDEVHRHSNRVRLSGTITEEGPDEVTIRRKDNGKTESVATNDIDRIQYDGPVGLEIRKVELLEQGGEYQKAVDGYARAAEQASGKPLVVAAAQFGRARALGRQAERDPERVEEAVQALREFRDQHAASRFRYPLHVLLGQLELARGNRDAAREAFAELATAPWPALRLKAALYEARLLLAAGDHARALAKFDEIAQAAGDSPEEKVRQQEARVGRAECLIRDKKHAEAESLLREVIEAAATDQVSLQSAAFNLLGDVQRETGRPKEAILSYLYVDLLYSGDRGEHAKALCYVALLWDQIGRPERAEEARARLQSSYPTSPWAKLAEAGAPASGR